MKDYLIPLTFVILAFLLIWFAMTFIANAQVATTTVRALRVMDLQGGSTRCLNVLSDGNVTSTGSACGSGSGSGVEAIPSSTAWTDSRILFGQLGGTATTSLLFSVSTSTGVFTAGSSSLASVSSTNITASGYVNAATLLQGGTAVVLTSRTINTTAPLTGGGALSGNLTLACATCLTIQSLPSSTSWVNSQLLFGQLDGTATSSRNFTITTSTVIANNRLNVIGTVSSTEIRSPSSTILNLRVTDIFESDTATQVLDAISRTLVSNTGAVVLNFSDPNLLTIDTALSLQSTLSITEQSNMGSVSSTNLQATGYLRVPTNCSAGDFLTQTSGGNVACGTPASGGGTIQGTDGEFLFKELGNNATSTTFLTLSTSTGLFTLSATSSITGVASATNNWTFTGANTQITNQLTFTNASGTNLRTSGYLTVVGVSTLASASTTGNVTVGGTLQTAGQFTFIGASGTNIGVTGYGLFPTLNFTNASGTRLSASTGFDGGRLSVTNATITTANITNLFDFNGNKYSTSTGGGSGLTGITTTTPIFSRGIPFFIGGNSSSVVQTAEDFIYTSSTGIFSVSSSSLANVSGTAITVSRGQFTTRLDVVNASASTALTSAILQATGQFTFVNASGSNLGISTASTSILRFANSSGTNESVNSSTARTSLSIPVNQTLTSRGQIGINSATGTLNYYSDALHAVPLLLPIHFVLENPTTTVASGSTGGDGDKAFFVMANTSTIKQFYAGNQLASGTVAMQITWASTINATAFSSSHLFTATTTFSATTTPSLTTSFASTTVPAGSVMRYQITQASSTEFFFTIWYETTP